MKFIKNLRVFAILLVGVSVSLGGMLPAFSQMAAAEGDTLFISGRTSQDGIGIQSQSITATEPGGTEVLFQADTSNTSGDFGFNVDAGTYDLHFTPLDGSGLSPVVYSNYVVTENQGFDIDYSPADPGSRSFSGVITDSHGNPVVNLAVSVYKDNGTIQGTSITSSTGHYSLTLAAGVYTKIRLQYGTVGSSQVGGYDLASFDLGQNRQIGVNLTVGDVVQDFKLNLVKMNVVARDSSGNPAVGASVSYSFVNPGYTLVSSGGTTAAASVGFAGLTMVNNGSDMYQDHPTWLPDSFLDYANSISGSATISASGLYTELVPQALTDFAPIRFSAPSICVRFSDSTHVCNGYTVTPWSDVNLICQQGASQCISTPSDPGGLTALSPTRLAPVLNWDSTPGATSYAVYRDGVRINSASSATFTDNSASAGLHMYYVTATNTAREGGASNTIAVLVDKTRPTIGFTSPVSFVGPFAPGPTVAVNVADASSGLHVVAIHVYTSSNVLLNTCGSASSEQLQAGSMSCSLAGLPAGTYYIKAGATDNAGNNQTINSGSFVIN